jgi:ribosomal protein L32
MIMRLPSPIACALQLVDDVVAERQGGKNAAYFTGISGEWRDRVEAYIDVGGSPASVPTWPAANAKKASFLNLYLSPKEGAAQRLVLDVLRDHDLVACPACGESGRPNTLDHYLPKDEYPHFCITPHNLFPMCDACQKEKGIKTGDHANPRFFLHPYFDVFIAQQVLQLTIQAPFTTPFFDLHPAPGLTPAQRRLVALHIRELAIVPRYTRFFREQFRRLLRLVSTMRNSGQDIQGTLQLFKSNAAASTQNSWEHVFYDAVLANVAFLDFLENQDLPNLL